MSAKNFQGFVCNVPKLKIKTYGNDELQFFSASLMTSFNQTSGKFFKGNVIPSADWNFVKGYVQPLNFPFLKNELISFYEFHIFPASAFFHDVSYFFPDHFIYMDGLCFQ